MKKIYLFVCLLLTLISCKADGPYDEKADAAEIIANTIAAAKIEKLPTVIIFGANWCPDCRGLSEEISHGKKAKRIANEFKIVKINVGNFDTNLEIANQYGNPISGGIPGAAILSFDGKLIYVTKPGELANARSSGGDGLYQFLRKAAQN